MNLQNYIGGAFCPSESKKTFQKLSPFDGSVLAEVAASEAMDVIKAIQAAKKASTGFKETTREQRADLLLKMATELEAVSQEVAYQEALHQGLSAAFVKTNSVDVVVSQLRSVARDLVQPLPANKMVSSVGIVGMIVPWALSLRLLMERLIPALAAGNVVVVKLSELSPITGKIVADLLQKAQVPEGVVNLLQGDAEVGKIIAGHPSIHAVTAVGRSSTLESIAKAGLSQFKKMQLSGSVKNPAIVLAGTDYQSRMPEIMSSFLMGQGQLCWNTSRLFMVESFSKEFLEAMTAYLGSLQPLLSPEGDSPWTPMITSQRRDEVVARIQEGRREHGKILWGGGRLEIPGNYMQPGFMIDLPNCSVLQQDELQGPLFLITAVKYQHEILKWANTSYLAHSAVVWGPEDKLEKITSALEVAQVSQNVWSPALTEPVFGLKQSSFGSPDMQWNGHFYSDVKILTGKG